MAKKFKSQNMDAIYLLNIKQLFEVAFQIKPFCNVQNVKKII